MSLTGSLRSGWIVRPGNLLVQAIGSNSTWMRRLSRGSELQEQTISQCIFRNNSQLESEIQKKKTRATNGEDDRCRGPAQIKEAAMSLSTRPGTGATKRRPHSPVPQEHSRRNTHQQCPHVISPRNFSVCTSRIGLIGAGGCDEDPRRFSLHPSLSLFGGSMIGRATGWE